MTRLDALNALALAASVAASWFGAGVLRPEGQVRLEQIEPHAERIEEVALPGGARGIRDASGVVAKIARYERIASASWIADSVLWELCEPERIIAVTPMSKDSPRFGYRHRERAVIASPADLEPIMALHPDLLFTNHFGDPRYVARLREQGIVVFDLGEMQGVSTLLPNIRAIGALIGERAHADALIAAFSRRLAAVAADIPMQRRPRALYLSTYGKQLFSGGKETSYDDVLRNAGLINVASGFRGWPALSPEQVLSLDPDVLVTKRGMARELCRFPGMKLLRACGPGGRVAELDLDLVDDPGLPMLELAEELREKVHGPRSSR